jgi:hypothetical protein
MSDLIPFLALVAGGLVGSLLGTYLASKNGAPRTELPLLRELSVVKPQPGDKIVLTLGDRGVSYASRETMERISAQIKAFFPGNQVIVLENDMGLSLVRPKGGFSAANAAILPTGKVATRSITIPFPGRRVGA